MDTRILLQSDITPEYAPSAENQLKSKMFYNIAKRLGDIFLSLIALTVLSPLMLAVMLVIMIDDFGNPFYTQQRVGKNGKLFRIYKFRSMYKNADSRRDEMAKSIENDNATFKIKDDPRITKIGGFIRKTSVDELPQLFNILKGDMSIIGPRPFILHEQQLLPSDRLLVKPGLSCYWQIEGKNDLTTEQQIELDRKYIQSRSALTDVFIILRTIRLVISGKNY